jgi:preprotein translocase SecE subunit
MKLFTYLKNVRAELQHVVWPSTKQALTHTGIVILLSAIAALIIALLDYLFTSGVGVILN